MGQFREPEITMKMLESITAQLPLNSDLVSLRLFIREDINEQYIAWLNDKDVVKYSNQKFIKHTKESCNNFFDSFKNSQSLFFAIENKLSGDVIGTLTIHCNSYHNTADVGILLGNKDYWGRGYAKQAWCTVVDLLSNVVHIRKITAGTLACNLPMTGLMKASNMKLDGIRSAQELVDGQPMDIVYYARFLKL
jgi:RimJ/RimL family protein N-acetyltransferase